MQAGCLAGRKGRAGLFPGTACIKLAGTLADTGDNIVVRPVLNSTVLYSVTLQVRGCALDSGSTTADTELTRISHCGGFYFQQRCGYTCLPQGSGLTVSSVAGMSRGASAAVTRTAAIVRCRAVSLATHSSSSFSLVDPAGFQSRMFKKILFLH